MEPGAGNRRARHRTTEHAIGRGVGGVAHPVEALAFIIRNQRAGTIRLTRWLDPCIGIQMRARRRSGRHADPGVALIAPVATVEPAIDAPGIHIGRDVAADCRSRTIRPAPAITPGIDDEADRARPARTDESAIQRLGEIGLVEIRIPFVVLGRFDRLAIHA